MNADERPTKSLQDSKVITEHLRGIIVTHNALIIVALPVERKAVAQILDDVEEGIEYADRTCMSGKLTRDGLDWDVLVRVAGRGNEETAAEVSPLADAFEPQVILFVGIAGGIKDVERGDVVYARYVKGYEHGAEEVGNFRSREPVQMSSFRTEECAEAVMQKGDWHETLDRDKDSLNPTVLGEPIAAGSKVLKSLDESVVSRIREYLSDCIAVEMEGYGFATSAYRHPDIDSLVIRGISDTLSDKDDNEDEEWQPLAASHAAWFGVEVLREYQSRYPERGTYSPADSYEERFINSLDDGVMVPQTKFDLRMEIADSDDQTDSGAEIVHSNDLVKYWNDQKRILLTGAAGKGKSVLLMSLARRLHTGDNSIAVFVNLKRWSSDYSRELIKYINTSGNRDEQLDIILRASISDITTDDLKELTESVDRVYVFVDGLNEIANDDAKRLILDAVNDYRRSFPEIVRAVASSRTPQQRFIEREWKHVRLRSLSEDEVRSQIDNRFGVGTYEELSDREQKFLSTPFFLNLVLDMDNPHVGSKSDALRQFFLGEDNLGLDDTELERLSSAGFHMYEYHDSTTFSPESFRDVINEDLYDELESSGVIRERSRDEATFMHQLLQDYLAARHLVQNPDTWNAECFDAVTIESASFDALSLAVEQIPPNDSGDRLLKEIYDWNWLATVKCLRENWPPGDSFSRELADAVLFTVAEKRFDRIRTTGEWITNKLEYFPGDRAEVLSNLDNMDQVLRYLRDIDGEAEWFTTWKRLYLTGSGETVTDKDVTHIIDEDSIIGWATANTLKRVRLNEDDLRQIRGYLDLAKWREGSGEISDTVAWRCVHVLGAYPSEANRDILFTALDEAEDMWVQYGAVRSLVEMTARISDPTFHEETFDYLASKLPELPLKVQEEAVSALHYKDPQGKWLQHGRSIFDTLIEHSENEERAQWEQEYEDFEDFVNSNVELTEVM